MPTPVEKLVAFIQCRRRVLKQGHNALARASDLDPGTLANVMVGRIKKAPSLATLQKLAVGLQCDAQLLVAIVSGFVDNPAQLAENPSLWEEKTVRQPAPQNLALHPLTPDERQALKEAEQIGLRWAISDYPEILNMPPTERVWIFRELERIVHCVDIHRRLAAFDRPVQAEKGLM